MGRIAKSTTQRTDISDPGTGRCEKPSGNQAQGKKGVWPGNEGKVERSRAKIERVASGRVETRTIFFGEFHIRNNK